MATKKSDNYVGQNFVIEDNIIKGTERTYDIKIYNVGQVILNIFRDNPKHVAQVEAETGKRTSNEEMKENSIRCALWMQKQHIGSGDVIAICTHNHLDAYIPCIATFYLGAIYNPWHHEITLKTAQHLMSLIRPKVIFSCEGAVKVLSEAARLEKVDTRIVVFGKYPQLESLKDIMRLQTNEEVQTFESQPIKDPDSIGMILFSSGTTGMPKGVAHSYTSLVKNIYDFPHLPSKQCISIWYSSLYWVTGTTFMLESILAGATRILHSNFDPEETCKIIDKFKINWFFITPSMITYLLKSEMLKKYKLKSLKSMSTGGARLRCEVIEELKASLPHVSVSQAFGMTELGGIGMVQTPMCKKSDSVGFVVPNVQLKIIDVTSGEILGSNQPGELCIKSPTCMVGYYKNPTATKESIDDQGWLHTGDIAYYADNGEVFIIDRLKEVMKFRGHHVSPSEIEVVLMGHPSVMETAVVPVPDDMDLERPMAFVKKVPGAEVTEEELINLSAVLGDYKKLWGGVKFLDELPHTAAGKINRKYLKEMAKAYAR